MSEQLENNEFIARWLSGDLSEEEKKELANRNDLEDLQAVIKDIDTWSLPAIDTQQSLKALKGQLQKPETKVISLWPKVLRYAAAVALIATCWFVFDYAQNAGTVSLKTSLAETLTHQLPDGSEIILGAQSSVDYSKKTWDKERTLNLQGQAFFDVEKGASFIVETALGNVKVLGTEFDVQTIGDLLKVNCFEGSVQVSSGTVSEILKPGQGVLIEGNNLERVVSDKTSPDWTGTISIYEGAALSLVAADLKRYYDVELSLPAAIVNQSFSGSFAHDNLEAALSSIFSPLEIAYELRNGRTVVFK